MARETTRYLITGCAGVAGALGVALAAVAAHRVDDARLVTAANMLVFHATAAVAVAAWARGVVREGLGLLAAGLMLGGAALFSGSIASLVFRGETLFPMSAPLGGSTLIGAWLLLAVAGFLGAFRSGQS